MTARGRAGGRGPAQEPSVAQIYEEALLPGEKGLGPVQGRRMLHQPRGAGAAGIQARSLWGQKQAPEPECVCVWGVAVLALWLARGVGCVR